MSFFFFFLENKIIDNNQKIYLDNKNKDSKENDGSKLLLEPKNYGIYSPKFKTLKNSRNKYS